MILVVREIKFPRKFLTLRYLDNQFDYKYVTVIK